jgi:hypothetical protein
MIHIIMLIFVQVEAAMALSPGPDARSPLVTGEWRGLLDVSGVSGR